MYSVHVRLLECTYKKNLDFYMVLAISTTCVSQLLANCIYVLLVLMERRGTASQPTPFLHMLHFWLHKIVNLERKAIRIWEIHSKSYIIYSFEMNGFKDFMALCKLMYEIHTKNASMYYRPDHFQY